MSTSLRMSVQDFLVIMTKDEIRRRYELNDSEFSNISEEKQEDGSIVVRCSINDNKQTSWTISVTIPKNVETQTCSPTHDNPSHVMTPGVFLLVEKSPQDSRSRRTTTEVESPMRLHFPDFPAVVTTKYMR